VLYAPNLTSTRRVTRAFNDISSVPCTNDTFGDPAPGEVKQCFVALNPVQVTQGPAFTLQPVNQSVLAGESGSFTVAVTGQPAPTLQWYTRASDALDAQADWIAIPGANQNTLVRTTAASDRSGMQYRVVATNSNATTTSQTVTLTVTAALSPPSITSQPQQVAGVPGQSVALRVEAEGSTPLSFQWRLNDQPLVGANSSSWTAAIQATDAGSTLVYSVEVTNSVGSVTRVLATVNVGDSPTPPADPPPTPAPPSDPSGAFVAGTGTGTTVADFEVRLDGVALSAPHLMPLGRSLSVLPVDSTSVYGEITWGDGRVSLLPGGWRPSTSAELTHHAYAQPGRYRIEYFSVGADGTALWRALHVAVVEAASVVAPDPQASGCDGRPPLRVLYVGNSQLAVNDVPRLVTALANSANASCPRMARHALVGSDDGTLRNAWTSGAVSAALRSGLYDTVVLAESIDLTYPQDPGYPNDFYTYGRLIIDQARSLGVRSILNATPNMLLPNLVGDFAGMATHNSALAASTGTRVAASGLAWLRAWERQADLPLFGPDNAHASYVGSVLSSYVLYAALTGASPVGLASNPVTSCEWGPCPRISEATAALLQQAAWQQHLASGQASQRITSSGFAKRTRTSARP
jgi:hypothetical protein